MPTPPSYLIDHGAACAEIGELAHLLARIVWCVNYEREDPLARVELAIVVQMAAQLSSVQLAAARANPDPA